MKLPTASQILTWPSIAELQTMLVSGGWLLPADETLSPAQLLCCVAASQLASQGLSSLAISLVLRRAEQTIAKAAVDTYEAIESQRDSQLPDSLLVLADYRFAACHGVDGFLDLSTGSTIEELPQPAATTFNVHLAALFMRTMTSFE